MKKSFFICLAAWLLLRTGAAEPVHSWDFNKEPLKPKLYGSELRDHALVCGEKHNNAATGFRNYFEAFTLELRFKPEEEFSKPTGGLLPLMRSAHTGDAISACVSPGIRRSRLCLKSGTIKCRRNF